MYTSLTLNLPPSCPHFPRAALSSGHLSLGATCLLAAVLLLDGNHGGQGASMLVLTVCHSVLDSNSRECPLLSQLKQAPSIGTVSFTSVCSSSVGLASRDSLALDSCQRCCFQAGLGPKTAPALNPLPAGSLRAPRCQAPRCQASLCPEA